MKIAISASGDSTTVSAVDFDTFWGRSRYYDLVPGVDLRPLVQAALDGMVDEGGWYSLLAARMDGGIVGTAAVFRDPWYRSRARDDVACFGLVTADGPDVLKALVDATQGVASDHGIATIRGPVNPPRSLLGYGVQTSGYAFPILAGTSVDPPTLADAYASLWENGYFSSSDHYVNLVQDFEKTWAYVAQHEPDRSLAVINPDLNDLGDLPGKVAELMNGTLSYRPDYLATSAERLAHEAQQYRAVPGGEKLLGFYMDGDVLAGGVIMQPDWFQVLRGQHVKAVVGDIYMLAPAYQGRHMMNNFPEYSARVLDELGATYYEHASIWDGSKAIQSTVKNGYASVSREYLVFEIGE
jgi:hypothetical protein